MQKGISQMCKIFVDQKIFMEKWIYILDLSDLFAVKQFDVWENDVWNPQKDHKWYLEMKMSPFWHLQPVKTWHQSSAKWWPWDDDVECPHCPHCPHPLPLTPHPEHIRERRRTMKKLAVRVSSFFVSVLSGCCDLRRLMYKPICMARADHCGEHV